MTLILSLLDRCTFVFANVHFLSPLNLPVLSPLVPLLLSSSPVSAPSFAAKLV